MLYLGIIYHRGLDGKYYPKNHRSILKILLNPILLCFGYFINSHLDHEGNNITGLSINKLSSRHYNIFSNYSNSIFYPYNPDTMKIVRKNILF